jgi:DnaD/phage-associated family protein
MSFNDCDIRYLKGVGEKRAEKLYKLGIVSLEAFNEYLADLSAWDDKVRALLENLGIKRYVNEFDREFYRTWTEMWNFSDEIITWATGLSVGKANAMQYMNKILAGWKAKGITTIEQAKANSSFEPVAAAKKSDKYTKEQLGNTDNLNIEDQIYIAEAYQNGSAHKQVWFIISENLGKYYITIYYDNVLNMANGDDL